MVDWSQFFRTDDMVRLDFRRITQVGLGTVFSAVFSGIVAVILGIADIPIALISTATEIYGSLIASRVGAPTAILRGAFAGANAFVQDSGAAGFFVAVGIVLATLWAFSVVVSRVR